VLQLEGIWPQNNVKMLFRLALPDIGKSIFFFNFPGFIRLSFRWQ